MKYKVNYTINGGSTNQNILDLSSINQSKSNLNAADFFTSNYQDQSGESKSSRGRLSCIGSSQNSELYKSCVIDSLASRHGLKMVLGASNDDLRFHDYDVTFSDERSKKGFAYLTKPVQFVGDFNLPHTYLEFLERTAGKFSLIAFDASVMKFLRDYNFLKEIIKNSLETGGLFYIPLIGISGFIPLMEIDGKLVFPYRSNTFFDNSDKYIFPEESNKMTYKLTSLKVDELKSTGNLIIPKYSIYRKGKDYRPDKSFYLDLQKDYINNLINQIEQETGKKHIIVNMEYPITHPIYQHALKYYIVVQRIA